MLTKFIIVLLGLCIPDSSACVLLCLDYMAVYLNLITFSIFFNVFAQSVLEPI